MFTIYKMEYDFGFITKDDLKSYIPDYDLSWDEYNRIVGEGNAAPQTQSTQQPANAQPAQATTPQPTQA